MMNIRRSASLPGLIAATLLLGILVPRAASATQGAELYRTQAHFYGRFEARLRFAPGEGAVSSFFLWKEGSSSTTSWNELDFEKINGTCRMQTNIWTAKGTQSAVVTTPAMDLCGGYHTYAFEWTPDYIAWFIDGTQLRKVTGASVTEYTQNASQGMNIHFNLWAGDSSFGGVLNAATLPVYQYISWVQYSSYTNGAFQQQWREDFTAATIPAGWGAGNWASPNKLSTHNVANVKIVNGIAVLAMTADNATGYTGTPPADGAATGTGGAAGTGGVAGTGGMNGTAGATGAGGNVGGTGGRAAGGTSGTGGGSATGGSASGSGGGNGSSTGGVSGTGGGVSTSGGSGGPSGSGGAASGTGGSGTDASGGSSGTGGKPSVTGGGDTGCGCRTAGDSPTGAAGLFLLLLMAAFSYRTRRQARRQVR